MTREEASNILDDYDVNFEGHTAEEIAEAFEVAFRALEQEPVLDRDCEHCSKTYGTLGCCTTVSNKWVYSCKEGHEEYDRGIRKLDLTTKNDLPDEAFDVAVKALEQEPCEDAISREDALMALTGEWTEITDEIIHRFIKRIKALPPVNPQPKTGTWIDSPNGYFTHCSECGLHGDKGIYKHYGWCPKCGAKMIEPQESEDK